MVGHYQSSQSQKQRTQKQYNEKQGAQKKSAQMRHTQKQTAQNLLVQKPLSRKLSTQKVRVQHASPCAIDSQCGGCEFIVVPYEEQLAAKNEFMAQLFEGFATENSAFELRSILGMQDPFRYRNKIVSPFAPGKKGKREILTGMYAAGTHKIIPTNTCLIENEIGQQVVAAVVAIMKRHSIEPYNEDTGTGFMRHVIVRVGHTSGEVLVTIVTNEEKFVAGKSFAKELVARVPRITTVVQNVNTRQTNVIFGEKERVLYGPGFILDTLCDLSFRISSRSFYQVNATQTEVLYNTAIQLAGLTGTQTVIDAYCGTGTIGLVAAAQGAKRVIGVESNVAAVRDARENARHNGIENATFEAADATQFMRERAQGAQETRELVLFMDPPRAGSTPEFLQAAAQVAPKRIVYVSCNPETLVRDIAILQEYGYTLAVVQPVDMFPHTPHVETVALMSRVSDSNKQI